MSSVTRFTSTGNRSITFLQEVADTFSLSPSGLLLLMIVLFSVVSITAYSITKWKANKALAKNVLKKIERNRYMKY